MCACACLVFSSCGKNKREVAGPVEAVPLEETAPDDLAIDARAEWFYDRGRYAEALPLLEEIVEVRRDSGGVRFAEALLSLGLVRDALGDAEGALDPLSEAWGIFQKAETSPAMLGACADALGLACQGAGQLLDAEKAFLAAIDLRKLASPGSDEPWVSMSRTHLGNLYLRMARYEEAEPLLEMTLASAVEDQDRATRLRDLGTYHHTIGSYVRAIEEFEKTLPLAKKIWGEESEQAAAVLGDLGLSQLRAGRTDLAEANLLSSRELIAAMKNPAPSLLADSDANLAAFYLFEGDLDGASKLLEGAGDAVALNNLGAAYHRAENFREAAMTFTKARALAAETLSEHHPLRVQILQNEACLLSDAARPDAALESARHAGAAALELLDHLLAFGSENQKLEFRKTSDPLSLLCSFGGSADEVAEMVLQTKGVVLDSVLSDAKPSLAERAPIPEGKTFVDYFVFQKYLGKGEWQQTYGAVILGKNESRWVELGKSADLRGLLKDLQGHMNAAATEGKSDAVFSLDAVLEGLYDFCIAPLGEVGERLILSPGGDLAVVPFAVLRKNERFLCEDVSDLTLVTSGRLAKGAERQAGNTWAHCAVADYSGDDVAWPGEGAVFSRELWEKVAGFGDLPGVEREQALLAKVADFKPLPVDEFVLRRVLKEPVRVLHFSCHGFFLSEGSRPMYRSGLVLSGARSSLERMATGQQVDSATDNLLFAGEVAELDLSGTELVTLAACDTALGATVAGEGVIGLQRGFQIAGAQNILMTLWAVSDERLPEILQACYTRIAKGETASAAVWKVQADLLRKDSEKSLAKAVWTAGGFTVLARSARAD